ncbi:MAG: amino acid transporter, partial [Gemmataceae bacterium]|nr:amino acid transporter [Gemmataceae bacterium]
VVILWFAGASAMAGLLNLVPQYLPRFGMAPEWARATRPLVLLFTVVNLVVTLIFRANVDAQSAAYATGVLVLITSGCVASVIDLWQRREGRWYARVSWPFVLITLVFVYTTVANVYEKPDGIKIATFFILTILVTSFWSRYARSRELRFAGFKLADAESRLMWDTIRDLELSVLVPHRPGRRSLANKEAQIRREHRIPRDLMIVFVEVELADASDFVNEPVLRITQEEGRYVAKITGAASIAHTLAALALEMAKVGRPPEVHFGWTDDSPVSGTLGFLLFGEGNVPWMVRDLLRRAEPDETKRPLIIIAGTA